MKNIKNIVLFLCLTMSIFFTPTSTSAILPLLLLGRLICNLVLLPVSVNVGSKGLKTVVAKKVSLNLITRMVDLNQMTKNAMASIEKAPPRALTAIGVAGAIGTVSGIGYIEEKLKENQEKNAQKGKKTEDKPASPSP